MKPRFYSFIISKSEPATGINNKISIKIENIKLNLDSKDKYNSFSNSFIVETEKGSYINSFKEFMKGSFGKDYSKISFVKEFESITNKQINF